jgi:FkbM family methyltransferase
MNWKRMAGKILSAGYTVQGKIYPSFSQAGEDQVIRYLFQCLFIEKPTYLDIGTNHPFIGNNTFLFYSRGSTGVCIEPDPNLYNLIKKHRKRDVILNAGIGPGTARQAKLYMFPDPYSGWNTFSEEEATSRESETGIRIRGIQEISLVNINEVMAQYFKPWPNLVSIDVEGMDLDIIRSIDFDYYRPEVICAETITFSMQRKEEKLTDIANFLATKGYFEFGDTHINTVFCREDVYKTR